MNHFDVIIAGAGIVGLSAAIAMRQRGFSVALVDAGNFETGLNNRVYAINEASQKLLQRLGAWSLIDPAHLSPYKHMQVWDAKSGAAINFDSRIMAAPQLGFILEESDIRKALNQCLDGIHLFPESPVEKVIPSSSGIRIFSREKDWQAKLLIIADGAGSPTRKYLQVPMTRWSYHQQAIVANVSLEKPHQQTAWQVFHPEGPLAFLPMPDPLHCSIVWTNTVEGAEALMRLEDAAFNQRLTAAFGAVLGKTRLSGKRQSFPLSMQQSQQYSGKSWLLAGDAAHTIHPLAGLGLNLGLADIAAWLRCLEEQDNNITSMTALGKYQRQRKTESWQVILLMEALKSAFGTQNAPLTALRSLGLRIFDSFTPLKRLLIAEAMGR